jgi:hypothetical protein
MLACQPPLGHLHVYTDGSGLDVEIEGNKEKRFGAGIYSLGFTRDVNGNEIYPSYHRRGIFTYQLADTEQWMARLAISSRDQGSIPGPSYSHPPLRRRRIHYVMEIPARGGMWKYRQSVFEQWSRNW